MPDSQIQDSLQGSLTLDQALSLIIELLRGLQVGFAVWHLEESGSDLVPRLILSDLGLDESLRAAAEGVMKRLPCLEEHLREVSQTGKVKNVGPIECGDEDLSTGIFAVKILPLSGQCVAIAFETTRAHPKITHTIERQAKLIDLAKDAFVVIEFDGKISCWNGGAERMYGWREAEAIGQSLFSLLETEFPRSLEEAKACLLRTGHWAGEITNKRRDGTHIIVSSHWTMDRDQKGNPLGWLQIDSDLTEQKEAEDSLRKLSGRLLSVQDEERRRIARELHDSTAQTLSGLALSLAALQSTGLSDTQRAARILQECRDLSDRASQEIRNLSHLLHPPDLDTMGLIPAVRWYATRFSERTGIRVELDLPHGALRLPSEVELALFRIVQESLNNIHRHSGSLTASVRICFTPQEAVLQVQDQGHGIRHVDVSQGKGTEAVGIGIAGMRTRLRQLGGILEIDSTDHGTTVAARVPLEVFRGRTKAS
jgi:PAS domain S-box-containing protein